MQNNLVEKIIHRDLIEFKTFRTFGLKMFQHSDSKIYLRGRGKNGSKP